MRDRKFHHRLFASIEDCYSSLHHHIDTALDCKLTSRHRLGEDIDLPLKTIFFAPQSFLPRYPPHIRRDPLPLHLLPPYLQRHSDDGSITHIGNQSFGWRARQGVET